MACKKTFQQLFLIIMLLGIFSGCKEKKNEKPEMSELIASIKQDSELQNGNTPEVTDSIDVIIYSNETESITQSPEEPAKTVEEPNYIAVVETPITKSKTVVLERTMPSVVTSKNKTIYQSDLLIPPVLKKGSFIKIGNDKSYQIIERKKPKKVTTVIFTDGSASYADIYIYAIPVSSKIVRNQNTLIAYGKNIEMINRQAQLTKFWNGRRVNGTYLKPGKYNIYVEHHYKNHRGMVNVVRGRYWGGRNWKIEIR